MPSIEHQETYWIRETPVPDQGEQLAVCITFTEGEKPTIYLSKQLVGADRLPTLLELLQEAQELIERKETEQNAR